jgi:membrane fusion protein, heavy metal efflux system
MILRPLLHGLALVAILPLSGADERATVVLDPDAVANLRLEFANAETISFEETVFALGRIEARPGASASVTSRIPGRVIQLSVLPGDAVARGAEVARIESRLPGDPPAIVAATAPISGTVAALHVAPGDPVEPERAFLEIMDLSEVEAVARLPETAVGRARPGTRARLRLVAYPEETFTSTLVALGSLADPGSGTVAARFRLPNADGRLRPGMRVEFTVVTATRDNILAVPRDAVQSAGASRFVFVRAPGLAHGFVRTPVVTGTANDTHVEIVRGLAPSAEVVTRGSYSLSFAGEGSASLKEALDAAHGHEHAADGSELHRKGDAEHDVHGHDHAHDEDEHGHPERPWQVTTALLAIAVGVLAVQLARLRGRPRP